MTEQKQTKEGAVPAHLGIILDGNRRWAKKRGLPAVQGHRAGLENFKDVSLAAFDRGVNIVSAYIFSTENWQRASEEVGYLMNLVVKGIAKHLETYHQAGIKIVMVGSRHRVDKSVLGQIDKAVERTKDNRRGTLALCFNYGGQQELADAAQALIDGGAKTASVQALAEHLYQPQLPSLDLIIRTSGEQRLSGFMLWRAAYAELYFTDTLWPDFNAKDLDQALAAYAARQRRFGS